MVHPASPRITHKRNPGVNDKPRDIAKEKDDSEGSRGHYAKLVAPDVSSEKEIARLEHGRLVELERKLSAMLAAQTERDRRIAQLADELALLKQSEANEVEAKKRAGLELRELKAKLDELVLSRDHALEQAQSALQKATSRAAEANERGQQEGAEVRAELEARKSELAAIHLRLKDAESGWAKSKAEADTSGTKTAANLVNTDDGGVTRRLMERVRAIEAKMALPSAWSEKSFEMMECSNED